MRHGSTAGAVVALCLASALSAQSPADPTAGLDSLLAARISTAAKYEQTVNAVAGAVTIVTADDIARHGYRTLADVLQGVRGFYLSNDRNYSYLGARGFSRPTDYNNRVLVLLDGTVTNEGTFGSALVGDELAIDLASLERIEIVRGPGSALYGTGAMFAVINLITKTGATIDGARLTAGTGSYGQRGASLLFGRRLPSGLDVSVSGLWQGWDGHDLFYPEFDAPATHDGVAHNLDWERAWGIQTAVRKGEWSFHARYGSRSKAIPTASYGSTFDAPSSTWDALGLAELRVEHPVSARARLIGRTYYQGYRYAGEYSGTGEGSTDAGASDAIGVEGSLQWDLASANRLTLGGEFRSNFTARYYYPRTGTRVYDLSAPYGVTSIYLQDEHQFTRRLSLLVGIRRDEVTTDRDGTAPRAAIVYAPSGATSLKLLYGRAFRAPTIVESEEDDDYVRRNPALRPEQGTTVELVAQRRIATGLLGTVSVFNYTVDGLIDPTTDPAGVMEYRNVGNAEAAGAELGLDARLGRLSGYLNYTVQRARDRHSHETLTNSPAHLAKAGAELRVARALAAAVDLRWESSRRTVYGTTTDPFFMTDLTLTLTPHADRMDFAIRIANLFDAEYATPGGTEHVQPAIAQDGRTAGVELRYRF